MFDLNEYIFRYSNVKQEVDEFIKKLDIKAKESKSKELLNKSLESDFWDEPKLAEKVLKEKKKFDDDILRINNLNSAISEIEEAKQLLKAELELKKDLELIEFLQNTLEDNLKKVKRYIKEIKDIELLGDKENLNAIISIHAGAGGTESQDWANMLYRMYIRFCNNKGFKIEEVDINYGEVAGIKSVTAIIKGDYASELLKGEMGVHRLVRISPFDAGARRHTSFASVEILPEISEDINIEIADTDIRIDTYRASGAGGQHVNKTESAVRIVHLKTGIVVTCQNERSQIKNKESAMKILKSKLFKLYEEQRKKELGEIKGETTDIAWGHQIRSYVFSPYTLVKDHRTNFEVGNVLNVLNGDIEEFIHQYLIKGN